MIHDRGHALQTALFSALLWKFLYKLHTE